MGFVADCEKYNVALIRGWHVLRFVPRKGWIEEALTFIRELHFKRALSSEG